MSLLPPAYQGAPYYQPRRPPRRYRALRMLRRALIIAAVLALVILTGALLVRGSY
jgi:hypothetical protein